MGMTSKTTRQTERPKPPTWEQIEEDMKDAKQDDIVFLIGREESRERLAAAAPGSPVKFNATSTKSRSGSESDLDASLTDSSKIHESCQKVERLLELYEQLRETPSSLQDQYSRLKGLGEDMTESINELKALSQTFNAQADVELSSQQQSKASAVQNDSSTSAGNKGKGKHKKKK